MLTTTRSLVASNRDAAKLVEAAQKFSVRLPLIGKVSVPPPDQLAFYGVLGLLAAVEVIDWPVALAIGVGQAVISRHLGEEHASEPIAAKTAARKAAPRKTPARKAQPRKAAKVTKATKRS